MEKERVTFSVADDRLTAHIHCEIDHHTARSVRENIDRETFLTCPKVLVLDLSEVGFMDSSGIALILGRVEVAAATGGVVALCGASPTVMRLIRLSGIERVKGLCVLP
ncbi:MAG: anti-sigma factor antagonist [Clostridia bacterium]|nr:anti-sigma factor antagonist [Clostridia bacterium]